MSWTQPLQLIPARTSSLQERHGKLRRSHDEEGTCSEFYSLGKNGVFLSFFLFQFQVVV
jgi:hypothetical protein